MRHPDAGIRQPVREAVRLTEPVHRLAGMLSRTHLSRRATALVTTGIVVAAAVIAWVRVPATARGVLWAEDASVFSARALGTDPQSFGVFTPYAGYTHAMPQLIADVLWAVVPTSGIAVAITATTCAIAGCIAGLVFGLLGHWGLPLVTRSLLAFVVVLSAGSRLEVLGNLANLHWLMLWLAPFLFLARPRTWAGSAGMTVVALAVVATEIQSLAFLPLAACSLERLRPAWPTRRQLPVVGAAVCAAAVQLAAYVATSPPRGGADRSWLGIVRSYFLEVPLTTLVGSARGAAGVVVGSGWQVTLLAVVPFLLALALCLRTRRMLGAAGSLFAVASFGLWAIGFGVNYFARLDYSAMNGVQLWEGVELLRYAIVPIMFLTAILVLATAGDAPQGRVRWTAVALVLSCLAAGAFDRDGSGRVGGPEWDDVVVRATASCGTEPLEAQVFLEAAPTGGWGLTVPCALLR